MAKDEGALRLTAAKTTKRLVPGAEYQNATVWAFNRTVPGPELRLKKGIRSHWTL